jgi:hypothetical protein
MNGSRKSTTSSAFGHSNTGRYSGGSGRYYPGFDPHDGEPPSGHTGWHGGASPGGQSKSSNKTRQTLTREDGDGSVHPQSHRRSGNPPMRPSGSAYGSDERQTKPSWAPHQDRESNNGLTDHHTSPQDIMLWVSKKRGWIHYVQKLVHDRPGHRIQRGGELWWYISDMLCLQNKFCRTIWVDLMATAVLLRYGDEYYKDHSLPHNDSNAHVKTGLAYDGTSVAKSTGFCDLAYAMFEGMLASINIDYGYRPYLYTLVLPPKELRKKAATCSLLSVNPQAVYDLCQNLGNEASVDDFVMVSFIMESSSMQMEDY